MLNRINQLFQDSPKNLLSIYFCAGCPTLDGTADVIRALERNGVSMIEIGIPFSDPMADGIVIQNAATRALHNGMSLRLLFEQLRDIRRDVRIPLVLMGYLNPIMQFAVLGLACVVGGVISSQGSKFFQSGIVIFVAVLLHNGFGYFLGYCAGKLTGMNTAKKRTISIEVGMQNAGLATNLATTTAQFASTPESAIICAVSCVWHSISGTLLAGLFAQYDKMKATHKKTATAK